MKRSDQHVRPSSSLRQPAITAMVLALFFLAGVSGAQAQTITVLHSFTGGADGSGPLVGVTLDPQGRIYGTVPDGGSHSQGVVFRLVHQGDGWVFTPIYAFGSQENDGNLPEARVLFGPDGLLYGTTNSGGSKGYGTVFRLQPPATACKAALCPWLETILYNFTGKADGGNPFLGDLAFDQAGNIYGTTAYGGSSSYGVIFKLARSGSSWTESVLWDFTCGNDGCNPYAGVIFDSLGNLYGTTQFGGTFGEGTVYELSPTQSGWSETTLTAAAPNGSFSGGLAIDSHGDLFGITGNVEPGAVYEVAQQNGSWSLKVLKSFNQIFFLGPLAAPTLDAQGNLYGPVPNGGSDEGGEIFKLAPSGGVWIYSDYHDFANGGGEYPIGAVTFDASGNMYGTANGGGVDGGGTVWEITP